MLQSRHPWEAQIRSHLPSLLFFSFAGECFHNLFTRKLYTPNFVCGSIFGSGVSLRFLNTPRSTQSLDFLGQPRLIFLISFQLPQEWAADQADVAKPRHTQHHLWPTLDSYEALSLSPISGVLPGPELDFSCSVNPLFLLASHLARLCS